MRRRSHYDVQSDERDQHGERIKVVTAAKAGVVLRLNAGIYSIVSTYGDANAMARADVTVEAGKLAEVTLAHAAAKVTFKLVTRRGGDAIADTQWSLATAQGEHIKQSSGALPTHFLAPGAYVVSAKHAGRLYQPRFQREIRRCRLRRGGDAVRQHAPTCRSTEGRRVVQSAFARQVVQPPLELQSRFLPEMPIEQLAVVADLADDPLRPVGAEAERPAEIHVDPEKAAHVAAVANSAQHRRWQR